jgi:hypothetical protein
LDRAKLLRDSVEARLCVGEWDVIWDYALSITARIDGEGGNLAAAGSYVREAGGT